MIKIELKPSTEQLRQFGWIGIFGFSAMAVMVMWQFTSWEFNWAVYLLFGLAALCLVLAPTAPNLLKPIFLAMMILAIPIGFVVSAVLLRVVYYGLFTPIAWGFKLKGRDEMDRTLEPDAESYWKDHRDQIKPRAPASYMRLY